MKPEYCYLRCSRNLYPATIQLGRRIGSEWTRRTGKTYTEDIPAMHIPFGVRTPRAFGYPAEGHRPIILELLFAPPLLGPFGADEKVRNFDCGSEVLVVEEFMDVGHNSLDVGVAFARSSMFLGGRHLEDGEYDGVVVGIVIDGERIKKGVARRDRDVVFVLAERHLTKVIGEVDIRDSPVAGWYR